MKEIIKQIQADAQILEQLIEENKRQNEVFHERMLDIIKSLQEYEN